MVKKSMTEAEAIEVIRKVMHHFARAIQRLEKAEGRVTLAGLTSEYHENAEKYEEAVAACMLAIKALKEIQEYRAIGSVEDLKNLYYLRKRYEDETYDYCGEYGTEECGAKAQLERLKVYEEIGAVEAIAKVVRFFSVDADGHTITEKLDMLAEYKKIGTLEECREAREKQKAKRQNICGGVSICLDCGWKILRCHFYCPGCGQCMERSEA